MTPDTILGWYRRLVAAKYDGTPKRGCGRPRKSVDVHALVVRMARENPRWGYTRLVGAMKNLGHELGRNTVKRILAEAGIAPAPERRKEQGQDRRDLVAAKRLVGDPLDVVHRHARQVAAGAFGAGGHHPRPFGEQAVRQGAHRQHMVPDERGGVRDLDALRVAARLLARGAGVQQQEVDARSAPPELMWKPYLQVIARKAPQAVHVLDRFHVASNMSKAIDKVRAEEVTLRELLKYNPTPTSELDPDLDEVKRFIKARIAEGAIAVLIAAVLALLARMRDLNTELHKRLEASRRKRPPSETLHRLQMELPFWGKKPDNDTAEDPSSEDAEKPKRERKKRGPKQKDLHGRPKLPAHLQRVPEKRLVPEEQCTCPDCKVETSM